MKRNGFTLIEIIAVLVILGLLAAVAIPKYNDLQARAAEMAARGAVAAAQSNCTLRYSKLMLQLNGATVPMNDVVTSCQDIVGDFTVACSESGDTIAITATGPSGQSATGTWISP